MASNTACYIVNVSTNYSYALQILITFVTNFASKNKEISSVTVSVEQLVIHHKKFVFFQDK